MNYLARIRVTPKPAILDPAGKAVAASLHSMGYGRVGDVRLGKYIEVDLEGDTRTQVEADVDAMCRRLLANDVIEDFHFEVEEKLP
jgi:phosphoribosylformylglycinamidine synthase